MPRDDAVVQLKRVVSHSLHPDFATPGHLHYHDVSVLVLDEGLDLGTEFVRPVHLPTVEDVERMKGGSGGAEQQDSLVVTGWGHLDPRRRGKLMQENLITTFSNSYCDHIFNGTGLTEGVGFTAGLGCGASPLTLRGVCTGDDGSGLVKLDHDIRRFVLMGVLTDDPFDPDCGTREKPNVFVRVWADSILTFLWKEVFGITLASPPQIPHISQQDISEV